MPFTTAAMGLLPSDGDGAAVDPVGLAEVAGVEEIPGRDGVAGAAGDANGAGTNGAAVGTLKLDPGAADTDTREPPSAMKNMFSLGFPGGFQTMRSEPAV